MLVTIWEGAPQLLEKDREMKSNMKHLLTIAALTLAYPAFADGPGTPGTYDPPAIVPGIGLNLSMTAAEFAAAGLPLQYNSILFQVIQFIVRYQPCPVRRI